MALDTLSADTLRAPEVASQQPTGARLHLSKRAYQTLWPFNPGRRWLRNRIRADRTVPGLSDYTLSPTAILRWVNDDLMVVRRRGFPSTYESNAHGLLDYIRNTGTVAITSVTWDPEFHLEVAFNGLEFTLNGTPVSPTDLLTAVSEHVEHGQCVVLNLDPAQPFRETGTQVRFVIARGRRESAAVVARSVAPTQAVQAVEEKLVELFSQPGFRFTAFALDALVQPDGSFLVTDLLADPPYPQPHELTEEGAQILNEVLAEFADAYRDKRGVRRLFKVAKRKARSAVRRAYASQLRSTGFTRRMAGLWVRELERDVLEESDEPAYVRARRHRAGFLTPTVERLGVTEDNHDQFISDRDYMYAQPFNGTYGKWVRDRVSSITVFEPFRDRFETMHYQFMQRDGQLQVIPLSPVARDYSWDIHGIADFLEAHPHMELVAASWAARTRIELHYKDDGSIEIGGVSYTVDEFHQILTRRVRTQFLVMREPAVEFATLVNGNTGVNTRVQVTMMNPTGADPRPAEAFVVSTEALPRPLFEQLAGLTREEDEDTNGESTPSVQGFDADQVDEILARDEHIADAETRAASLNEEWDSNEADESFERTSVVKVRCYAQLNLETGEYTETRASIGGKLHRFSTHPVTGAPIGGTVAGWNDATELLTAMCEFAPQLRFVRFTVVLTDNGPRIVGASPTPRFSTEYPFREETTQFLRGYINRKRAANSSVRAQIRRWAHNTKLRVRRKFAQAFYPAGLVPYQSVRWLGDMRRDLFQRNGVSLPQKLWAYRNGFLSYRIPQYGITPENRGEFISDFEYRWLRHINKKYKYWLEDKISIKYVAAEFNEFLPGYYYYTNHQAGKAHLIPMMDCPEGYGKDFSEVLRLVREKGLLALKPDEGSHGDGFYRLAYEDGEYTLNGETASGEEVLDILRNPENRYLVTEFIIMHPDIARIYPQSVNTLRMTVFKKDGITPVLGNAYMRVGSSASGFVDNTAAGGLLVEVDIPTGRYGNAQMLDNGRVMPCEFHPDTHERMEGVLPRWEETKEKVLEMARSIPQLEYMGFDVAITEDGFKLPEINRMPDFPRIDKLTPEIIDYLLYKLDRKKRRYGYHKALPKKLISLPPR